MGAIRNSLVFHRRLSSKAVCPIVICSSLYHQVINLLGSLFFLVPYHLQSM